MWSDFTLSNIKKLNKIYIDPNFVKKIKKIRKNISNLENKEACRVSTYNMKRRM